MKRCIQFAFTIAISILASSLTSAQDVSTNAAPFDDVKHEFEVRTFSAAARNNKVFVNWTALDVSGNCAYIVQRSLDGTNYDNIGIKKGAPSPGSSPILFSFTDEEPVSGNIYYRLKRISEAGVITTASVKVNNSNGEANIAFR